MRGNLHKHASRLPPPLFVINEIKLAFAGTFKDVIATNCLSIFHELEVALFDVCLGIGLLICPPIGESEDMIWNVENEDVERIWKKHECKR